MPEEKDILVVFSSPELLDDIFSIADHGLDFLWLWWRTQLSALQFFFILKGDGRYIHILICTMEKDLTLDSRMKPVSQQYLRLGGALGTLAGEEVGI